MLLPSISIFTLLHHHLTFQLVMPTSSPSSTPLYLHSLQYPFLPIKFEQNSINLLEHFLTSTFISLPSSFLPSLIPLLSPQPSTQWVNYVIRITNFLHSPTFFQLHYPSFIISQDNPDIIVHLPSTPRLSLRQPIIIPLSFILMIPFL